MTQSPAPADHASSAGRPASRTHSRRRTGFRRAGSVLAAAAVVALLPGGPAAAATHTAGPPPGHGWTRYHQAPVTLPAGTVCAFTVDSVPLRDQEYQRTVAGTAGQVPRVDEFTGPLVVRFTNRSTGRSVVRDLSGTAFFGYGADGSLTVPWIGNGNITVERGNRGYPAGDYVFTGAYVFTAGADGNRRVVQFSGTREDLCRTLR